MSTKNKDVIWGKIIGKGTAEEGGYVGDLMRVAEAYISKQAEEGHISGSEVGQVMSNMIPSAFQFGINFGTKEDLLELEIDKAAKDLEVAERSIAIQEKQADKQIEVSERETVLRENQTNEEIDALKKRVIIEQAQSDKRVILLQEQIESENKNNEVNGVIDLRKEELQKRIDLVDSQEEELTLNGAAQRAVQEQQKLSSEKDVAKKAEDLTVLIATRQNRIDQAAVNLDKATKEAEYIGEQKTQLTASVGYNNTIKALDSYSSTLGTIGAGGLGVTTAMWSVYYGMIESLTNQTAPAANDIDVVKIT